MQELQGCASSVTAYPSSPQSSTLTCASGSNATRLFSRVLPSAPKRPAATKLPSPNPPPMKGRGLSPELSTRSRRRAEVWATSLSATPAR